MEGRKLKKYDACRICGRHIAFMAVSGWTKEFGWKWMCPKCFDKYGVGLGVGKGKLFVRDGEKWSCINDGIGG